MIVAPHELPAYEPLDLQAGDEVSVGRNDAEWPAFVWCQTADGRGSWIPEAFLSGEGEERTLKRAYCARELVVTVGEVVSLLEEIGGWCFVRNADGGEGWIPGRCAVPKR